MINILKKSYICILIIICIFSLKISAQPPGGGGGSGPPSQPGPPSDELRVETANRTLDPGFVFVGVDYVIVEPGDPGALEVEVFGGRRREYQVIFPEESVQLVCENGNNNIEVTDFTTDLDGNQGELNQHGEGTFFVGATFNDITGDISSGLYSGSSIVIVEYIE